MSRSSATRMSLVLMLTPLLALSACRNGGERSGPSTAGRAVAGLRLRLVAARTTLAAKQPLQLRAYLDNTSDGELVVMRRAAHVDLGLSAYDDDKQFITELLPPGPPMPPAAKHLYKLAAGSSVELVGWELVNGVNQQIVAGNGRTGVFRVHASYHAGIGTTDKLRQLDPRAWVGSLTSNEVVITIK